MFRASRIQGLGLGSPPQPPLPPRLGEDGHVDLRRIRVDRLRESGPARAGAGGSPWGELSGLSSERVRV